jgi:hypothetical protein
MNCIETYFMRPQMPNVFDGGVIIAHIFDNDIKVQVMFFEFLGKVDSMFIVPRLTTYIDGSFQIKVQISIRLQSHKGPRVRTIKGLKRQLTLINWSSRETSFNLV